jgi:hypothetical protein
VSKSDRLRNPGWSSAMSSIRSSIVASA